MEIINAIYDSSMMNNLLTVSLANFVGHPAKVIWPTTFFFKKKVIFVWLLCWPSAGQPGSQFMKCL